MIPGPTNLPERVSVAMSAPMINHRGDEFHELYSRVQQNCQKVFQTKNEIVVISGSGTAGVDAAMGSILKPGDSAIVPSFGEFSARLGDSASYTGANVIRPESELGRAPDLQEIEKAFRNAPSRVKALCVVFNETSTGVTWRKLKELKEIAAKHDALFVVDAISVLGGESVPVDAIGVDICIAGSQKCLAAPPGIVILSFSEAAKSAISEVKPRNQYFDIPKHFKFAEIHETPSTPAVPLFFALDEALKLVLDEGIDARFHRHEICANSFYAAFEALGLKPFAAQEFRSRTVIGIVYPQGIDDKMFRAVLEVKFGIVVAGGFGKLKGSMFRVGSMGEISPVHVTVTVSGVGLCLRTQGFQCDPSKALAVAWDSLSSL